MAYATTGHRYRSRLNAPRRPAWQTGHALGITKPVRIGDRDLTPNALSYATLRTITGFCHTAAPAITRHHVPRLRGLKDRDLHAELAAHMVPFFLLVLPLRPRLAEEANRWLTIVGAPIRLTGTPTQPTELGPLTQPDAVLCRTNVGTMAQTMDLLAAGHRVALVGGGEGLRALALAARDLPIDDAEARLAYVAVTGPRHQLDLGGLSWIHDHPDGR
jgi:hypothetical protein